MNAHQNDVTVSSQPKGSVFRVVYNSKNNKPPQPLQNKSKRSVENRESGVFLKQCFKGSVSVRVKHDLWYSAAKNADVA